MAEIERYIVQKGHEWAYIYIDEEVGSFMCQSSYGTYAYIWRSIGTRTLKQFLAELNFDYFMGKAHPGYQCFDAERSVENVKEAIIRCRRENDCDAATAREAWNELEYIETDNGIRFCDGLCRSDALMKILGGDYYEYARESADGNSRGFWRELWPVFLSQTREKIAA